MDFFIYCIVMFVFYYDMHSFTRAIPLCLVNISCHMSVNWDQPFRSIVFLLYPVDQFYCLEKPEYSEKTIALLQFTETNVSWKVSRRLNLLYYKDILCLPLGNTCYKGLRMCPVCRKQYPFHSLFMTYHTSARNREIEG
jgi:hypothetical protein